MCVIGVVVVRCCEVVWVGSCLVVVFFLCGMVVCDGCVGVVGLSMC